MHHPFLAPAFFSHADCDAESVTPHRGNPATGQRERHPPVTFHLYKLPAVGVCGWWVGSTQLGGGPERKAAAWFGVGGFVPKRAEKRSPPLLTARGDRKPRQGAHALGMVNFSPRALAASTAHLSVISKVYPPPPGTELTPTSAHHRIGSSAAGT